MHARPMPSALRRFFGGLTEYAFGVRLGVADPAVTDYLTELLVRFVRADGLYRLRAPNGRPLLEVADMMAEAEQRQGTALREIHRHIGDFTLFWSGVYPECVSSLRQSSRKDSLLDYHAQGKRAYFIASKIPAESDSAEPAVLHRLSDQFELCVYGLGEVRREWERRDDAAGGLVWE